MLSDFISGLRSGKALSPLDNAIRQRLRGCPSLKLAAPAIFLLAHDTFDSQALRAAALIYEGAAEGERFASFLREEARLRDTRTNPSPTSARSKLGSQTRIEDLVGLLTEVSTRIGLCARIDGGLFNEGVRAAQKEVEAALLRLPKDPSPVIA